MKMNNCVNGRNISFFIRFILVWSWTFRLPINQNNAGYLLHTHTHAHIECWEFTKPVVSQENRRFTWKMKKP